MLIKVVFRVFISIFCPFFLGNPWSGASNYAFSVSAISIISCLMIIFQVFSKHFLHCSLHQSSSSNHLFQYRPGRAKKRVQFSAIVLNILCPRNKVWSNIQFTWNFSDQSQFHRLVSVHGEISSDWYRDEWGVSK